MSASQHQIMARKSHALRNAFFAGLLIFLCGCREADDSAVQRLLAFDSQCLERHPIVLGRGTAALESVGTLPNGAGLFWIYENSYSSWTIVLLKDEEAPVIKPAPGAQCVLDANGKFVAWLSNSVWNFHNGHRIPLTNHSRIEFSTGGRFFSVTSRGTNTSLYLMDNPETSLGRIPGAFLGTSIYEQNGSVILFGRRYTRGAPAHGEMAGYVLTVFPTEFRILEEIDLSWGAGVNGFDVTSGAILVRGKSDIFPRWFLYDPKTKKRRSLGIARQYGFFLQKDVKASAENTLICNQ